MNRTSALEQARNESHVFFRGRWIVTTYSDSDGVWREYTPGYFDAARQQLSDWRVGRAVELILGLDSWEDQMEVEEIAQKTKGPMRDRIVETLAMLEDRSDGVLCSCGKRHATEYCRAIDTDNLGRYRDVDVEPVLMCRQCRRIAEATSLRSRIET